MSRQPRFTTPDAALAALALRSVDDSEPWVRLVTADGLTLQGRAVRADVDGIDLMPRNHASNTRIAFTAIWRLEVQRPNRLREWVAALALAGMTTIALVGAASAPLLSRLDSADVFMAMFAAAAAVAPFLLARTPLGRWLRSWEILYVRTDRAAD